MSLTSNHVDIASSYLAPTSRRSSPDQAWLVGMGHLLDFSLVEVLERRPSGRFHGRPNGCCLLLRLLALLELRRKPPTEEPHTAEKAANISVEQEVKGIPI